MNRETCSILRFNFIVNRIKKIEQTNENTETKISGDNKKKSLLKSIPSILLLIKY